MGYSHRWNWAGCLDRATFATFAADARNIIFAAIFDGLTLAGPHGEGQPIAEFDRVEFNGQAPREDFESFILTPDHTDSCKTGRRPYDAAVCAVLLALVHHFPAVKISTDGNPADWEAAVSLYERATGRPAFLLAIFRNADPDTAIKALAHDVVPAWSDGNVSRLQTLQESMAAALEAEAHENARAAQAKEEAKRQELAACTSEKARILAAYSFLEPAATSKRYGATLAAENIRRELKHAFPSVKFSVRADSFSMGDSVDVSWTDGPTEAAVKEITAPYESGHFNGMEDIYEYRRGIAAVWGETFGDAKYVSEHRHYSAAAIQSALDAICGRFQVEGEAPTVEDFKQGRLNNRYPSGFENGHWEWSLNGLVHQHMNGRDLTPSPVADAPGADWQINETKGGVEIRFQGIPSDSIRDALKSAGFRWSKAAGHWWAKRTTETEDIARQLVAFVSFAA